MIEEPRSPPAWNDRDTGATPRSAGPLTDTVRADAVVVGGGVTGSSTALHLARTGKSVIQLEAKAPGWGSSGRAFGNVVPCSKHSEDRIVRRYGPARGARLNAALAGAPDLVRGLLDEFRIDAALADGRWLIAAHTPSADRALRAQAALAREQGADVAYHGPAETAEMIGSDYYRGCLNDRRALSVDALAYGRGLARAAQQTGVTRYDESPAVGIERIDGSAWRVSTPEGEAIGGSVFLCTNAYSDALWPGLARSFIPVRGYSLISQPISGNLSSKILPNGHHVTDTRHLWSGIRKLPGGRLHVSTGGSPWRASGRPDQAGAIRRLQAVFPDLGPIEWEDQSTGWIAVTWSQLPKLLRLGERVWGAVGYSGRGLAFGTLLGRELAKLVDDPARDDLILPVEAARPLPFHGVTPLIAAAVIQYYALADRWADWRYGRR